MNSNSYSFALCVLGYFLVVTMSITALYLGATKPYENWDIVGYVAAALKADGYNGQALQEKTYDIVKSEVSDDTFDDLTHGDHGYRDVVYRDPVAFNQQLPFYTIRVFYVESIRIIGKVGHIDYAKATNVVSGIFTALSVLVLAAIGLKASVSLIYIPVVASFTGFLDIGRLSTPDAVACFFSLLAIFCLLKKTRLVFVIAMLLPFARTDYVLFSLVIMIYTYRDGEKVLSVVSLMVAILSYVYINKVNGDYGWLVLFNFTLINITPYVSHLSPSRQFADYAVPYQTMLGDLLVQPQAVIFALALYYFYERKCGKGHGSLFFAVLFVIPMTFVVLHLLLFPTYMHRYFVAPASLIAISLLGQIKNDIGNRVIHKGADPTKWSA